MQAALLCQIIHGQLGAGGMRKHSEIEVTIYVNESSATLPLLTPATMTVSRK